MWFDRLLGKSVKALPATIESGRFWIERSNMSFNTHTKNVSGVLVTDDSELCKLGQETHRFVLPEKSLSSKAELFCRALETLDGNLEEEGLSSPLMPASVIDDQSHLLPFEEKLLDVVNNGHLHQVSLRPRLDLHYEDEVTDISRAKRLAKGAFVHLASHSENWQRQTLSGVIPRKILARFSEDDYNIYENRVYARLLDKIESYLYRRVDALKQLQATLNQALEFYETTELNHRLRTEICRLWGQTFDETATSKASELLYETLQKLEFLLKTVIGLKQTGLYLLVHLNAQVGRALHLTNILSHDPHYRHLAILWDLLNKVKISVRITPEERYKQNLFLADAYSRYAGLALRHALQPYMAGKDEAEWAGRTLRLKKDGMEWVLHSSVPHSDPIRGEVLLTMVPWFNFLASPHILKHKADEGTPTRIIAWPAMDQVNNKKAMEGGWIALSPFDLYCVERFGQLIERILYRQVARGYGKPLTKIPGKALELAAKGHSQALYTDNNKHELVVREALPDRLYSELKKLLNVANATQQANMLELRQQEILAIQACPVCSSEVKLIFQQPSGFRANCKSCGTERYLRNQENTRIYEQKLEGGIDFLTTGRRTFLLSLCSR